MFWQLKSANPVGCSYQQE